jgi:hypothetical protein
MHDVERQPESISDIHGEARSRLPGGRRTDARQAVILPAA